MLWDLRLPSRQTENLSVKGAQVRVEVCHAHMEGCFWKSTPQGRALHYNGGLAPQLAPQDHGPAVSGTALAIWRQAPPAGCSCLALCVQVAHPSRRPGSSAGLFSQANAVAITSLQFLRHSTLLASASDTTSAVKLWDVRMLEDPVAFLPAEQPPNRPPPHLNMAPLNTALPCDGQNGVVHLTSDTDGAPLCFAPHVATRACSCRAPGHSSASAQAARWHA